jgi:ATP-binding cassette subfamily B protein
LPAIAFVAVLLAAQALCELALPAYTRSLVDDGIMRGAIQNEPGFLLKTGGGMFLLTLGSVCAAILISLLAGRNAAAICRSLRSRLFARILSFSNAEIDRFTAASLITRATNDIQHIQTALVMSLYAVLYAPIMGIGGVIRVAGTDTGMTWIIAAAVAMVLILVIGLMRTAMPRFKISQTLIDRLNLVSREILTGIQVIRAFGRERQEETRFDAASRDLMKNQLFTSRAMSFLMPAMMFIMNLVTVMIVWFGAGRIEQGNLEVGGMMAFSIYAIQIMSSFMLISLVSIMLPRANVAAERVEEALNTQPSIVDPDEPEDGPPLRGELRFNEVNFRFPGAEEDALSAISFTVRPGETAAIIGGTGSGKSALVNLIPRLYDVTGGSITIDGVDLRRMSQARLRSCVGFVPQRAILFSGDIAANIKYGGPDVSGEAMEQAAVDAQAAGFIAELGGWRSSLSQGGGNVSGGQRQRLAIARALAKQPKIAVFDDSFSALDFKTDAALRRALRERLKDAAVIIVAQRISTVMGADRIIVLNQGRIAGTGTHRELLKTCPPYAEIARSQFSVRELGIAEPV